MQQSYAEVARVRPVELVRRATTVPCGRGQEAPTPLPRPAPSACVRATLAPHATLTTPVVLTLLSGEDRFEAVWHPVTGETYLEVRAAGALPTWWQSRRRGVSPHRPEALALTLTGPHLTLLCLEHGTWVARARHDVSAPRPGVDTGVDTRDETWLAGLHAHARGEGALQEVVAGGFGQLGLRDVRVVTTATGEPWTEDGQVLLSATSAGPGFFDTAHASLWRLDPTTYAVTHASDLFFRRPDAPGAYGDHAVHVVRHEDRWLVATSTWADFDVARNPSVRVTLAETDVDVTRGEHLLDTRELPLPTDGLRSVGVWDPYLLRDDRTWRVGFVSARKYFEFHPALASGPTLDELRLDAAATRRRATEGTTLARIDGELRVLASDGRDNPRRLRGRYPVLDLDLREVGTLDAPYPTNIPWPTLVDLGDEQLLVTFDGTPYGGDLLGYGTHGDLVVMRGQQRV